MGFQPKDMPQPFAKNGNQNRATNKRNYFDRLVTVQSYNLGQSTIICTDDDGRKIEAHVGSDTLERIRKSEASNPRAAETSKSAPWVGYLIDDRMAKKMPSGARVVLDHACMVNKVKKNNDEFYVYEISRVGNVSDPDPAKTFEGLFSVSTYDNRIFGIQHWSEKAVDIGDSDALGSIRAAISVSYESYKKNSQMQDISQRENLPTAGVQFRVIKAKGDGYEVVDTSAPFDWISRVKDENGKEVTPGSPLSVARFDELCNDYADYVANQFNNDDNVMIEILTYKNYMCNPKSRNLMLSENQYNPLNMLSNVSTKLALNDDYYVQGKNYAVKGVLVIGGDKIDRTVNGIQVRQVNYANRLYANGAKGNVQAWVRASDGKKCTPHESLKQVIANKSVPGQKTETEVSASNFKDTPAPSASANTNTTTTDVNDDSVWGQDDGGGWGDDVADPFVEPSSPTFGRK